MSNNVIENQRVYICTDQTDAAQTVPASSPRDLFTEQTGQALIAIGKMFVNVPPFNDHIDSSTGEMLISIGKKLKKR